MKYSRYFIVILIVLFSCAEINENNVQPTVTPENKPIKFNPSGLKGIPPIDVSRDTNYIQSNTGAFSVELLLENSIWYESETYGPQKKVNPQVPAFSFGEALRYSPETCSSDQGLLIFAGSVFITDSLTYVMDNSGGIYCSSSIDHLEFLDIQYDNTVLQFEEGNGLVKNNFMYCNDTAKNDFELSNKSGKLVMKDLGNLHLFEFDLDQNGQKEIYLISYFVCLDQVSVFRIE
jgi:hypothetical protein